MYTVNFRSFLTILCFKYFFFLQKRLCIMCLLWLSLIPKHTHAFGTTHETVGLILIVFLQSASADEWLFSSCKNTCIQRMWEAMNEQASSHYMSRSHKCIIYVFKMKCDKFLCVSLLKTRSEKKFYIHNTTFSITRWCLFPKNTKKKC